MASLRIFARTGLTVNRTLQSRYISTSQLAMADRKHIKLSVKDDVAIIKIDVLGAKQNTLNLEMMPEFDSAFEEASNNPAVKSVVLISGKTSSFVAGADINMIQACKTKDEILKMSKGGQEMFNRMEKSKKPVVSAIMGPCLGGGFEIALATHYRIAVNDSKTVVGLPEVMLGLLPGSGGTQRLPRLIGVPDSLDMALTGKMVKSRKAKSLGIVDLLVDPLGPGEMPADARTLQYLEEVAIGAAKKLSVSGVKAKKPSFTRKATDFALSIGPIRDFVFNKAKATVMGKTKGLYPAPLKIIDVIKAGVEKGQVAGYEAEAQGFAELAMTDESKALINIFQGQTACKKNRFGEPKHIAKNLGVLGAGLMGAGIASVSIDKGYNVILKDMSSAGLSRGFNQISKTYQTGVKRRKYTQIEADKIISNMTPQLTFDNFGKLDMVIEAVFEDINVKHRVIKEVEKLIPPHCIFASNTSALPIGDIAKASIRPDKVIGMHYFSPVEKMQLLEIITTPQTSNETIASAVQVGLKQGRVVIVVKDGPGFYTTRVLSVALSELFNLFQEGVCPKLVDKAAKAYGFPVGNATLLDEVGIDVGAHIFEYLSKELGDRCSSKHGLAVLQEFVAKGYLGRKNGKGIYLYEAGVKGSDKQVNPGFTEIMKRYNVPTPPQIKNDSETVQWRLALKFVNEAVLCLQEGIVNSPAEGDIGAVFGLGFPPMKGGPFKYVDIYGADKFVEKLNFYESVYGPSFKACDLLKDHAKNSKKFYPSN